MFKNSYLYTYNGEPLAEVPSDYKSGKCYYISANGTFCAGYIVNTNSEYNCREASFVGNLFVHESCISNMHGDLLTFNVSKAWRELMVNSY